MKNLTPAVRSFRSNLMHVGFAAGLQKCAVTVYILSDHQRQSSVMSKIKNQGTEFFRIIN